MKRENTVDRHAPVAEDIIGALRRSEPVSPCCWIACYEDRPLQGNPPGSDRPHLLIFSSRYQYQAFVSGRRQFYAPEPLSAVAVDSAQTLRDLVEAPARDPRYSPPPFGLLLNFAYPEGRTDRTLSPDQIAGMSADRLEAALGLAALPRADRARLPSLLAGERPVDRRQRLAIVASVATGILLILACALLIYFRPWVSSSTPATTATLAHTVTPSPAPAVAALDPPACASIGDTWARPTDGMTMVCVPAGEFLMGSTNEEIDAVFAQCAGSICESFWNELPQHTVYLDAFWLDQTEVTNTQYSTCVSAGACRRPMSSSGDLHDGPDEPVVGVSRDDARDYAAWVGGRLPTEAEWEKAARGTDGRIYPWGDSDPDCSLANVDGCLPWTAPVGSYPAGASPYGALDMAGNVWEWVADWFGEDYYGGSPERNPEGPDSGKFGVVRGGARGDPWFARCACRHSFATNTRTQSIGFRLVVAAGASEP